MRFIRHIFMLTITLLAMNAHAFQGKPVAGSDYTILDRPQSVDGGKKVEVLEFFGYFCPGCNAFEPYLEEWIKKQGDRIVVKRVHTDIHGLVTQQKLYFSLEAMGLVDQFQAKVFNAYHIERNRLSTDDQVMKFIEKQKIDTKKFAGVYNSFSVQSKVSRVAQLQNTYKVNGVPSVVIDGRYVVSPADVAAKSRNLPNNVHPGILVMDWLVEKAYNEKNAVMTSSK